MQNFEIPGVGKFELRGDYWACHQVASSIGAVDFEILGSEINEKVASVTIRAVYDQIGAIDSAARAYLLENARADIENAGALVSPMVLLGEASSEGSFTVFYSGAADECASDYGVEFRKYVPFDLTIGD
jgi:hypothetical protein